MQIQIDKHKYEIEKFKLRDWLQSEEIHGQIVESIEKGGKSTVIENIFLYIEKAISEKLSRDSSWYDIAVAFLSISNLNIPRILPILSGDDKKEDDPWDYPGRIWYSWLHSFAQKYHWDIQYVASLDVDDAVSLLQEISLQNQFEREWQWSLNEIAYPYNDVTKKSEFRPLTRPNWMTISVEKKYPEKPQVVKIPKNMLPVGKIIGNPNAVAL